MKLVFAKPEETQEELWVHEFFSAGMMYEGIYVGTRQTHNNEFEIGWNNVHKFWDISLFPILGNPGNPTKQFYEFYSWLNDNGYTFTTNSTWTWFDGTQYDGMRFWVYPKKDKNG